jgi:putative endonuclease
MQKTYYCYLLKSTSTNRTYIGYTTNIERRLAQHNKILVGGAKATRMATDWVVERQIQLCSKTKSEAMKLEYRWKQEKGLEKRVLFADEWVG